MNEFRVRIGRVIRKGGADVKIIDGKFQWHDAIGKCMDDFRDCSAKTLEYVPDLAGFVIIGWDIRGRAAVGYENTVESSIPTMLIPSFVADHLRNRITKNDTIDAVNDQWATRR